VTDDILFHTDGQVGVITLNRPDRLNAITSAMLDGLSELLAGCDADRNVRAIVLTGAGRGFCSGLDLQAVAAGTSDLVDDSTPVRITDHPPFVLRRIDTPVVCALNGPAAGYGMDLALGCDLLLASDTASFVSPVRRSLVPESGGTWLLPRLIGWQKACEVVLLARTLDAPEIARLGFDVVYLVPIHPIGRINRKGKNNSAVAEPGDPGSPYAIGSAEGGHRAEYAAEQDVRQRFGVFGRRQFVGRRFGVRCDAGAVASGAERRKHSWRLHPARHRLARAPCPAFRSTPREAARARRRNRRSPVKR